MPWGLLSIISPFLFGGDQNFGRGGPPWALPWLQALRGYKSEDNTINLYTGCSHLWYNDESTEKNGHVKVDEENPTQEDKI